MKKDRINNTAILNGVTASTIAVDTDGVGIDLQQYADGCMFVASVGAESGSLTAACYLELEIEESADNSTFTDAADADVIGSVTGNNTGTFAVINAVGEAPGVFEGQYTGIKRYARPVLSFTGTSHSTGFPISIVAVALGDKYPPTT